VRSCRRTTEQRYLDRTWPDERRPDYGRERSCVRTQEDSIRQRGNYVGAIMCRLDDSPEHQTPSGRGGRAPDAVTTQGQGTRHCHDVAAGHQTLSRRSGMAPDAVRTQSAKRSVPGWRQDSGWKQRQITTQRQINLAS